MTEALSQHSPLGGSGTHRWMPCPGSVALSDGVEDPESEYAAVGTAAHALAALCLAYGTDAWEYFGKAGKTLGLPFSKEIVDKDMADAVQIYLDAARQEMIPGELLIEQHFHCPNLHEYFWGTADLSHRGINKPRTLHIWDYKHGAGIMVEVQANPQLMYYGVGVLEDLDLWEEVDEVVLHVVQPRGFHYDGPIREWTISVKDLKIWLLRTLLPAMGRADFVLQLMQEGAIDQRQLLDSGRLNSGEQCRFCPARYRACLRLLTDTDEFEEMTAMIEKKGGAAKLTNAEIGRYLSLGESLKIAVKAARETGFARAEKGAAIPDWKLVRARANREWKEGAKNEAASLGDAVMTVPVLKSPAKIDTMPGGKQFTSRMAFKPNVGLQLVKQSDTRQEESPTSKSMFEPTGKKRTKK